MTQPTSGDQPPPSDRRRVVIHATCSVHGGGIGFANLVVTKRDREIELDPHVDGSCKLTLAEHEACVLRDALARWLG